MGYVCERPVDSHAFKTPHLAADDSGAAFAVEGRGEVIDVGDDRHRIGVRRVADKIDAGLDLGPHRAGAELAGVQVCFGFVGRDLFELLLVGLAVVDARIFDGGEDHERRRFEMASQQAGGAVFVDDGRDAADAAVRIDGDRDAAAAAADDDLAGVDKLSIAGISMILRGSGDGTTRRNRPLPSSRICQPSFVRCVSACAAVSPGPIALFGS